MTLYSLKKTIIGLVLFHAFFAMLVIGGCAFQGNRETLTLPVSVNKQQLALEMPYQVDGVTYRPITDVDDFSEEGIASWYGPTFHGQLTSNKEVYDMNAMTAAHKTLPFNTMVKVINLENGAETVVRINDRGPFSKQRVIDLSYKAAKKLGMVAKGTANVRLIVVSNKNEKEAKNHATPESYTIQVAVFKNQDNANKMGQKLENSKITPFNQDGTQYHRVLVGSFTDFDNALKTRDEVRKQGYANAYIVPDN